MPRLRCSLEVLSNGSEPRSLSVARFAGFFISCTIPYPALKCWAIIIRPLRGRLWLN
jgi:hypothetical protein